MENNNENYPQDDFWKSFNEITNPDPNSKPKKLSKKTKIAIIIGAVLLIASLTIGLVFFFNNKTTPPSTPLAVANKLVASIQNNKPSEGYDLMSANAKERTSLAFFEEVVKNVGPLLVGKPEVKTQDVRNDDGSIILPTATIAYEIAGNDGKSYLFTIGLSKSGETWYVANYDIREE